MTLYQYCLVFIFCLLPCQLSWAQGSLIYRFDRDTRSNLSGSSASDQVRRGLNQAFGPSNGSVGGQINVTVPAIALSQQRANEEAIRSQFIRDRWTALNQSSSSDPADFLRSYNDKRQISSLVKFQEKREPDELRRWISTDPEFKRRAASALYDIRSATPKDKASADLQATGENAIELADQSYAVDDVDAASFYFSIARASADLLIGVDPVTGTLRAVYEATTGVNLITGAELSDFERGLAVVGVVTLGYSGGIVRGVKLFKVLISGAAREARMLEKGIEFAGQVAKKFSVMRSAAKAERSESKLVGLLVEAGSGPRQRAEHILAKAETVQSGALRIHPELYRLEDKYIKNISLGSASRAEIEALGQAFVGENAIATVYRQNPSVKIFRSADGRRVYRQPFYKSWNRRKQANFEVFAPPGSGRSAPLSDAHIDLK